jgi:hypothetical protein
LIVVASARAAIEAVLDRGDQLTAGRVAPSCQKNAPATPWFFAYVIFPVMVLGVS